MAVTAGRRAARDAGQQPPDGPFTHQALEGFRRAAAADTPTRRGQAGGLTADECAAILATCMQRRRTGRGLERTETAERRGHGVKSCASWSHASRGSTESSASNGRVAMMLSLPYSRAKLDEKGTTATTPF